MLNWRDSTMGIVPALFSVAVYSALAGCTTSPPAAQQDQESVSIESRQPGWTRPEPPTGTDTSPEEISSTTSSGIAVIDAADVDAPTQHKLALLQSSEDTLEGDELGYYIDTLEARLIQEVREDGVEITRQGDSFTVLLSGHNVFASNQLKLEPAARQSLGSITAVLEEYRNMRISIYGHTDDLGDEQYNQWLSLQRAQAVADFLVRGGVAARRILIIGYGEAYPRADNASPEGRARNRRIELLLEPLAK